MRRIFRKAEKQTFIYSIIIYYNMQTIIKQTREVGTSAGVLLPRSWLNKRVVVTLFSPSKEEIVRDILDILVKMNLNEEVKGIYLVGSYARGDYDADSDIDVLVITKKTNKLIDYGSYEITLISEQKFSKKLLSSLYYLAMIKEAKVIMNRELLEKYLFKKRRFKIKKILEEIEEMIKINRDVVEMCAASGKNVPDGIIYSIILRLRESYLLKCLILNKGYYKKDFLEITGEKIYSAYSRIKRNEKEIDNVHSDEVANILDLSEKWLRELKEQKRELRV